MKKGPPNPFKRLIVKVFLLCFTSQNETSKGSPETKITTLLKVLSCQTSHEGGIVLFRLLVSIYIGVKTVAVQFF
jgi:hypothetical protein